MSTPPTDPAAEHGALPQREPMPRHTTPTWEMELLISGATVFTLTQLPAVLDAGLFALVPRFERSIGMGLLVPYLYVQSAIYALITTFILHLALRGYWVGLVGLRSVYPDGVRWDGLRWGPLYRAAIRERMPSPEALVERADNRASQVFGFGIGFALLMLAPLALMIVVTLLAYVVHQMFAARYEWSLVWQLVFAVLFLPFGGLVMLDRALGRRIDPDSTLARGVRRVLRGYLASGFSSFANFPIVLFLSRVGERRGGAAIAAAVLLLVVLAFAQLFWREESSLGSYARLVEVADGDVRTLAPEHYADQRGGRATMSPQPFIASEIARGDYLRLFVPYRPTRDNPAFDRVCPPPTRAPHAVPQVLDCLAQLYPLALDGVPIADPHFDRAEDTRTGLRGVVAMIRIAELAPGRHELRVGRPPSPRRTSADEIEPGYLIPFWR